MTVILPIANVGALALYLLFIWLGVGDRRRATCPRARATARRPGLASGLLLSVVGALVWLRRSRPRSGSDWRVVGPFPWQRAED